MKQHSTTLAFTAAIAVRCRPAGTAAAAAVSGDASRSAMMARHRLQAYSDGAAPLAGISIHPSTEDDLSRHMFIGDELLAASRVKGNVVKKLENNVGLTGERHGYPPRWKTHHSF